MISSFKDQSTGQNATPDPDGAQHRGPEARGGPNIALGALVVSVPVGIVTAAALLTLGLGPATALTLAWASQMLGFCAFVALGLYIQDIRACRSAKEGVRRASADRTCPPRRNVGRGGVSRRAHEGTRARTRT